MVEMSQDDREKFFAESDVKKLNEMALNFGLLISDSKAKSLRNDFTEQLGRELTAQENRIYLCICELSRHGVATYEDLYSLVHSENNYFGERDKSLLQMPVSRIRKKLGQTSIISRPGLGYIAR